MRHFSSVSTLILAPGIGNSGIHKPGTLARNPGMPVGALACDFEHPLKRDQCVAPGLRFDLNA
ncbi:MAG: hypothetical protein O6922_04145, partial [Chloroflexi bacterium]|nr:hypothetical protein [Chloroflexota bacterium]